MKAMPLSTGMALKNLLNASRPPADAPILMARNRGWSTSLAAVSLVAAPFGPPDRSVRTGGGRGPKGDRGPPGGECRPVLCCLAAERLFSRSIS